MSKYADIIERLEKLDGPLLDGFKVRDLADLIPAVVHDAETSWIFGAALSDRLESLGASIALVERMLPSAMFVVKHGFTPSAMIWFLETDRDVWPEYRGATYSIALLIAMFRALEAKEDQP